MQLLFKCTNLEPDSYDSYNMIQKQPPYILQYKAANLQFF